MNSEVPSATLPGVVDDWNNICKLIDKIEQLAHEAMLFTKILQLPMNRIHLYIQDNSYKTMVARQYFTRVFKVVARVYPHRLVNGDLFLGRRRYSR